MADLPYMQFYPGDWLRDTRALTASAKGAWIDLLCAMWISPEPGMICMRLSAFGRLIGLTEDRTAQVIDELADLGVCDRVNHDDGRITVICRRIVRDWSNLADERNDLSSKRSEAARARWDKHRQSTGNADGKQDGCKSNASAEQVHSTSNAIPEARSQNDVSNTQTRPQEIPTPEQVKAYARSAPVPISEACATAFFDTQQASGWVTKHGHPIADWQAAMRRYATLWNEIEKAKPPTRAHREDKAAREYPEPQHKTIPLPRA